MTRIPDNAAASPFEARVASLGYQELVGLMKSRHSVRSFDDRPIEGETLAELEREIAWCNAQAGLSIQLVLDNPEAFDGALAKYGSFRNVRNHFALIGPKGASLDERCGYYGERLVLLSQSLELNTCWVALTFRKGGSAAQVGEHEKFALCIVVGYGTDQGKAHKVKPVEQLCRVPEPLRSGSGEIPSWFTAGMNAAQLAPTAMNQQRFRFELEAPADHTPLVRAVALPALSCGKIDLGIAKLHFELGANTVSKEWRFA